MPVPQSYADSQQLEHFVGWLNDAVSTCGVSKLGLARAIGHDSTQQLNKFLRGLSLPMPETLKKLCIEMNRSWPTAFVLAGFYGEILDVLAALASMSDQWRLDDAVEPSHHEQFRSMGVLRMHGKNLSEAFTVTALRDRYHVGIYSEPAYEVEVEDSIPADEAIMLRFESSRPRDFPCIVPKPLAVAIFIAVLGFPRRGDIYKDGAATYAPALLEDAADLIDQAINSRPKGTAIPMLLSRAIDILKDKRIPLDSRRVVASEFMNSWADSLCSAYTFYVRLAAFAYWGTAGSSEGAISPYMHMPQFRLANLPNSKTIAKVRE